MPVSHSPLPREYPVAALVRYRPGVGTIGYEDCLTNGCILGSVVGHTPQRVRVRFWLGDRAVDRSVNPDQLIREKE